MMKIGLYVIDLIVINMIVLILTYIVVIMVGIIIGLAIGYFTESLAKWYVKHELKKD